MSTVTFEPRMMKCGHTMSWPNGVEQPRDRDCNACLIEDGLMTPEEVDAWWAQYGVPRGRGQINRRGEG